MTNESKSKGDWPSLIPHNLFVAWSRDSDLKSIHYLSTEVQGSSTSWLDQACKWCMHFPVQIYKTDIQHLQLEQWKQMSAADQMDTGLHDIFLFLVDLGWRERFFFPQPCVCINIWWYQEKNNPLLLVSQQMCPPESLNVSTNKCTKAKKQDKYLDCTYGYEYMIFYKICKPNWWLYSMFAIVDKRTCTSQITAMNKDLRIMWDNHNIFSYTDSLKGSGLSLFYFMCSFIQPKDVLWEGCWRTVAKPCVGGVSWPIKAKPTQLKTTQINNLPMENGGEFNLL